jgi:hypothetical protein
MTDHDVADRAVLANYIVGHSLKQIGNAQHENHRYNRPAAGRSDLYRRAARGEVVFKKSGKSILIDYQSLKAAVAALPTATINVAQPQPSRKLITAPQRPGGKGSRSAARGRGARAAASA